MNQQDHDTLNNLSYNTTFLRGSVTLPEYCTFIQVLGNGSYGICCKCYSNKHNSFVTVKSIKMKQEFAISNTTMKEIQVLKQMRNSDYIQHLLDVNYDKNTIYLILEYCDQDLTQYIQTNTLDTKTKLKLAVDLAQAVKDLHTAGFINRDIKPSNCLVSFMPQIHLKLADFGLATNFQIFTTFTTKVATLPYKAPELCCNKDNYCSEVDIYSVGCTIYEIFTQNVFIKGENEQQVLKQLYYVYGSKAFNNQCYKDIREHYGFQDSHLSIFEQMGEIGSIIQQCMNPDYQQRPSAEQVVQMLQKLLDQQK